MEKARLFDGPKASGTVEVVQAARATPFSVRRAKLTPWPVHRANDVELVVIAPDDLAAIA